MKIIFPLFLLILISCDGYDNRLKISNYSSSDLYVLSYDTSSLKDYPNQVLNLDQDLILQDSTRNFGMFGANSEAWIGRVKIARNKKLNLFAIKKSVVDSMARDSIIKYEKYYKRLSYSLEELERMKWHVTIR